MNVVTCGYVELFRTKILAKPNASTEKDMDVICMEAGSKATEYDGDVKTTDVFSNDRPVILSFSKLYMPQGRNMLDLGTISVCYTSLRWTKCFGAQNANSIFKVRK